MPLTVWIPESSAATATLALGLARMAPTFDSVQSEDGTRVYFAAFADISQTLDLAVRLIGEVINIPGVHATINGRHVRNFNLFWSALLCYRDSLREPDPVAYCAQVSTRLGDLSGCPDRGCLSHCQFICTRCLGVVRETGAPPISTQLREIAVQAEVDWCPNLTLPPVRRETSGA
ncbi:MAG: hypothetical protein FJ249_01370 [Nitrospira sp.]|nr:hypothetical protein [Nitrospira sp.]